MDADKMRAEFEAWAKAELFDPQYPNANYIERDETSYYHTVTDYFWTAWQAAYAAGRKAEREAMQLKNWDGIRLGTTDKLEGER